MFGFGILTHFCDCNICGFCSEKIGRKEDEEELRKIEEEERREQMRRQAKKRKMIAR